MNQDMEAALDALLAKARKSCLAGVNAQRCGTRTDYLEAQEAEDAFLEARDAFLLTFDKGEE